ncbi:MAG: GDP-mannose 4,6-dehydratase, partial [Rhabdochlamydiaceae bacterium]
FLYIPTTDKSRQRVEACLNRLKIQWSSHGEFGFIYFGGKQWVDLLQQCGMNAHDKHVPSWMLGYEMPCLRSLLQGIIDSDGCARNEHWASKVITVSEKLVRDITEIGLKLGMFVSFSRKQSEGVTEGREISGASYDVYVSNENVMIGEAFPKSIHEEEYDGQVYCLEVQDNHNYVVERNGKVAFSGNSTSEIYGDPQIVPTPESYYGYTNSIGIRSCYDEGKRFAEALCMAYFRQNKVNVRLPRIFNSYGPRIRADGLYGRALPRFILQALRNEPITIYGDGKQTRSFCYVTDTIRGILKLATVSGTGGLVVNIGNPNEMTILDLAQKIIACTKSNSKLSFSPLMQDDPKRRCADISRAMEILGWKPLVTFDKGLTQTIEWFESIIFAVNPNQSEK